MNKIRTPDQVIINGKKLSYLIEEHQKWVDQPSDENEKYRLNLSNQNLSYISFNLCNLKGIILTNCNLENSLFIETILSVAELTGSSFNNAIFCNCTMIDTFFQYCKFDNAKFIEQNNITNSDFTGIDDSKCEFLHNYPYIFPTEGEFIAWKKIYTVTESVNIKHIKDKYIVKLLIPEDAKKLSSTSNHARCDKAKVLEIYPMVSIDSDTYNNIDPINESIHAATNVVVKLPNGAYKRKFVYTTYTPGEMVYPDKFDPDRWDDCSNGIHFFMNINDAIQF